MFECQSAATLAVIVASTGGPICRVFSCATHAESAEGVLNFVQERAEWRSLRLIIAHLDAEV
jgi:hypothetical protein